jgi:PII-like signaling protein
MEAIEEKKLLRVFTSSTDKFRHTPLYEMLVYAAQRYGMAGATVIRGTMGYGSSSHISSQKFWEISEKLPVIIEIIDDADKIDRFFETIKPYLEKIKKGCLVTIEPVEVVFYKSGNKKHGWF